MSCNFDYGMKKQNCIFCDVELSGQKSREHIFPLWLQERWALSENSLLQTHFSEEGDVLSDRLHDLRSHVCGRVCSPCNNGWMSQIETDMRPILIPLAESAAMLSELDSLQSIILARWACKTAYVLHAAANYRPIVPFEHLHLIRANATVLPPRVYVHAHQHKSTQPFAWWQGSNWYIEGDEEFITPEMQETLRAKAYKICFSIKDLILIVSHNPFPEMLPVLWKGYHFPVFPEQGSVFWFEREGFPDEDTQSACITLMVTMGLKQK